jgi:hypothetical protein
MATPVETAVISTVAGAISGAATALVTYLATRAKTRLELAAAYDKDLQLARLAAYKVLWAHTEPLARYGRESPITHAVLSEISSKTRTWYFQTGGIYLTQASRGPYFAWKALLEPFLVEPRYNANPNQAIDDRELTPLIAAASTLRTSLSDDIGTKRLSRL